MRGPCGVSGTNKKAAAAPVSKIGAAAESGARPAPRPGADECAQWLAACAPDAVTWAGWQAIDAHERAAGEPHGRPRVKLVRLADLVAAGRSSTPA
jgi:ferredoxin--NADP+ reductase